MFHPAEGMSHGDRKDGFVIVGVGAAGGILAAEAPASLKNLFGLRNGWQVKITSDDILQLKRTSPQL
jgi:hypothetical protein